MSRRSKRLPRSKRSFANQRGVSRNATGMTLGMSPRSVAQRRARYLAGVTSEVKVYDVSELPEGSKLTSTRRGEGK